jgi:glycosyltransferase involved in cell wall biosynthesis
MVSIIMPAFNASPWIGEAVASALAQTWRDLEVVVVDDGSTDDTAAIVEGIGDPRVRLIRQENRGQSAAANAGAAAARGEWLKFLDADDALNPGHLEAQLASIAAAPACVSCCRWGYFAADPSGPAVRSESVDRDYDDPLEWLADSLTRDEGMMGGWRWLIPRDVWQRGGGWDERLGLNNDFDFSIRILLASGGVRFAPGAVYAYRKGLAATLSGSRGRRAMESAFLTTELGCGSLLAREDSARIRRICADRWQRWLFEFHPEFPDLAARADAEVRRLGGSNVRIGGGRVLRMMVPVLGWKRVRQLQVLARRCGWQAVLRWKAARRARGTPEKA